MADTKRRHPRNALSAAQVRNAKGPVKLYDGHGLFLRVEANGAKRWVQRLVIRGKQREMGLGSADLVTLADARTVALENRKLARTGGDPLAKRREAEAVMTFEEAARKVHEAHAPTWKNPKHADQFINTLVAYVFPHFGTARIPEITSSDVLEALTPIWNEKPETARRVRQRVGMVMKYGMAKGWRKDNPVEAVKLALPKQNRAVTNRKALPYDEVAGCIAAVQASGAWAATKLCIEFLVLTAARSGEARLAPWSEIDLKRKEWVIPPERMKMSRPHRVPLSERAMQVLTAAEKLRDASGLVFPSLRGKALSDMTLSKLVKELGFDADVHGFRSSFRTWVQEMTSYPREMAEIALAHAVGDATEQAYARSDLFEKRREMMEDWAGYLSASGVAGE